MNFIIKLPLSKKPMMGIKFNSILIIVNRLIKWRTFIPYKKLSIVEDLVYVFL